jgi:hypothetical protein
MESEDEQVYHRALPIEAPADVDAHPVMVSGAALVAAAACVD